MSRICLTAPLYFLVVACGGTEHPKAAAPPPPPVVAVAASEPVEPPVPGPLNKAAIEGVIQGHAERFQACYDAGQKKNPSPGGQVVTRFVIGNDGFVAASEDAGSSISDPEVVKCVLGQFKKLRFPAAEESYLSVTYPMSFGGSQAGGAAPINSGPFRGCTTAEQAEPGGAGTTTTIECGAKKLMITDVPSSADGAAAQGQLTDFEGSFSAGTRKHRSTPKISGKACWATVIQDKGQGWGTRVVVPITKAKTRVVSCSGTPVGISRWCEHQIATLAKGYSPASLLIGR